MIKKRGMRALAVCAGAVLAIQVPTAALAATPEFGRTAEEWARLRDNVLEYEELEDLIHEYNTTVLNNDQTYKRTMSGVSFREYADQYMWAAEDLYEMAANAMTDIEMITYEMQAQQAENNATIDEQDWQTVLYQNQLTEKKLVMDAQSTMNSYYQLQQQLISAQKQRELTAALVNSAQVRFELGMATRADVLTAQQNLQNADAGILTLQGQIESARQKLIVMTGWKQDAWPEIKALPEVDFARIAAMDPVADLQTALSNDITLKLDTYKAGNVYNDENRRIYEQTMANDREQIGVALNSAYQTVQQARAAYDEAVLNLGVSTQNMATATTQYGLGSISRLEYQQIECSHVAAQTSMEIAEMALLQAIEAYDWVVRGVR